LEEHAVSIFRAEDGNNMFLPNVDIQSKYCTVQQHRSLPSKIFLIYPAQENQKIMHEVILAVCNLMYS
jgi:hypothetical protein